MEACVTVRPIAVALLFAALTTRSTVTSAQQRPTTTLSRDEIAALAKLESAIAHTRDSINILLSQARNKKDEQQRELRGKLQELVAQSIQKAGLSDADYRRRTYEISFDMAARLVYDSVLVTLTGVPLPSQAPAAAPAAALPAGAVGTHIGHVANAFADTPNRQGLLPTAIAEARIAAQHASLASRQPTNLDYMKTHAAHVIHALDPSIIATGPGQGYGVKKGAAAVAVHIELAATQPGASANVGLHAKHIATSARNTVVRADQIIALAQRIQAATTAADAAGLVSQMASLADQLINGADANGDARITPDAGEGGLATADEHLKLMLTMER